MSGNRLHRDARHHALAQVGETGQARIAAASALIIGTGGLGCAASAYLASSGIGHLVLCDFDTVDATNLGRQILFGPDDVGKSKAEVAAARLSQQNPDIRVTALNSRLSDDDLLDWARQVDIVLDGTDNFTTRFRVNDASVQAGRCLVSGSAIRLEGQLAVFGPDYATSPCYRCLYQEADESLTDCAGNGVFAPVPGVIGTMMAVEALKSVVGVDTPRGVLHLYDATGATWRSVNIGKREDCPTCGARV
jgi:adenylyltransferase/sulfurtransferase